MEVLLREDSEVTKNKLGKDWKFFETVKSEKLQIVNKQKEEFTKNVTWIQEQESSCMFKVTNCESALKAREKQIVKVWK